MRKLFVIVLLLGLLSHSGFSSDVPKVKRNRRHKIHLNIFKKIDASHNKWVAAGLDVSLGLFGVHRLYLGTEAHVPVMYTLTLGGGGVLVLVDLGLILFSKDIETYSSSSHIFMWRKED